MNNDTGEMFFMRTPYNYNTDAESRATGLACTDETRTQQQFKDEVNINTIVDRFNVTGENPEAMMFPSEQDFTEIFDFQSAMNTIVQARETFMTLPAKARARFDNNPQKFMEFIHDEENFDEAAKMGLIIKRPKIEEKPPEKPPEEKKKEGDTK